jgi:3-phenylpropionate/trans-cinnamate dioxygenase ferredoxin component
MNIEGYEKICNVNELSEGCGKRFFVNDIEIAVFKINGEVYALNNICPHQHTALIYDGFIEDDCVVCPAHGWMFDLKTGNMKTGRRGLDAYAVKVVDNQVYVKVTAREFNW